MEAFVCRSARPSSGRNPFLRASITTVLTRPPWLTKPILLSLVSRPYSRPAPKPVNGSNKGALSGVRILDLSRVLAAPLCTQILADYGADVIKIEEPDRGDDTRYFTAPGEETAWKPGIGPMSNYFAAINRNKRSVKLNLKHARGKAIFLEMVKQSDIVIENLRRGAMEKMGLGYDTLCEANPSIILACVSGYGPDGPFAHRAGYDMIVGAEAGLLHLTGERNGPPVRAGLGITDMSTGLYMHGAILAALHHRLQTGEGQRIDASLFETQVSLLTNVAMSWLNLGREAERWGTQHPQVVPYDAFKTKDLYFVCGAVNDKQFLNMCTLLGKPELAKEARFRSNDDRVKNRDELGKIINELFTAKTTDEWMQTFEGSGMPYGAINTMERVFSHPQTKAREMVAEVPLESARTGKISLLGPAVKFSRTKSTIRRQPPLHGEHTAEVLQEMGIAQAEQEELAKQGVI